MRSKTPEYRTAYWKAWRLKNLPYKKPRSSAAVCLFCKKTFKRDRISRKYCSNKCHNESRKGIEPSHLAANRGRKPRTYFLSCRDKHGCAEDREWRTTVFKRDDFTCRACGVKGGRLQAHHVKAFKAHPELRHVLSNGLTLCLDCHRKTDTYGWANYHKLQIAARRMGQEVLALTP